MTAGTAVDIRVTYQQDDDPLLTGYYLDTVCSPLDDMLQAMFESGLPLRLPQTPANDADMQIIRDALERLALRLLAERACMRGENPLA